MYQGRGQGGAMGARLPILLDEKNISRKIQMSDLMRITIPGKNLWYMSCHSF